MKSLASLMIPVRLAVDGGADGEVAVDIEAMADVMFWSAVGVVVMVSSVVF